jgi:hypothetical protein
VQYLSCDMSLSEIGDNAFQSLSKISNTILYQLYENAIADEQNPLLLETCNRVVNNPKQRKVQKLLSSKRQGEELPEMADALPQLSTHLDSDVLVAVDAVDHMSNADQKEFFSSLDGLTTHADVQDSKHHRIRFIVACRSDSAFSDRLFTRSSTFLDVGAYNREDIVAKLTVELTKVVGMTTNERSEAQRSILGRSRVRSCEM